MRVDRPPDPLPGLEAIGAIRRIRLRVRQVRLDQISCHVAGEEASSPFHGVEGEVDRDPCEIRLQGSLFPEAVERRVEPYERLLTDVFRLGPGTKHADHGRGNHRLVPLHQRSKCAVVSRTRLLEKLSIRDAFVHRRPM